MAGRPRTVLEAVNSGLSAITMGALFPNPQLRAVTT
jgi:hypothetical protein